MKKDEIKIIDPFDEEDWGEIEERRLHLFYDGSDLTICDNLLITINPGDIYCHHMSNKQTKEEISLEFRNTIYDKKLYYRNVLFTISDRPIFNFNPFKRRMYLFDKISNEFSIVDRLFFNKYDSTYISLKSNIFNYKRKRTKFRGLVETHLNQTKINKYDNIYLRLKHGNYKTNMSF